MPALATVLLPNVDGLVENTVTNSFAITGFDETATAPELSNVTAAIVDFYNSLALGQTATIASFLSDSISRVASACQIRFHDISGNLDGSPHGSPWAIANWTLNAAGDTDQLPHEVAFCVTLEAFGRSEAAVEAPDGADSDFLVDRPKQRKTGRIYLGPFNRGANTGTGTQSRPHATLQTDARLAVRGLANSLNAAGGFFLGVWSRKDAAVIDLESVSTDDAWDTQRRRGVAATARTRITVP